MPGPIPPPTINLLLTLMDTRPDSILTSLSAHPHLASESDRHGYSLLHAASSYNQLTVLRALVTTYNVPVDKLDEDGETALFVAEKEDVAKCLVEELGADWRVKNAENKTAEEKIAEEEGDNEVVAYLQSLREQDGASTTATAPTQTSAEATEDTHAPPPLPAGLEINMGTMEVEDEEVGAPDPEFRRRIEELAAREDFQSEEGQRQLRELVTEAVTGMGGEQASRSVRRRVD